MNIVFEKVWYKNFMKAGNTPIEVELNKSQLTCIGGTNGVGKCVNKNTIVKIRNTKTGEIKETTIGELYESARKIKNAVI